MFFQHKENVKKQTHTLTNKKKRKSENQFSLGIFLFFLFTSRENYVNK